MKKFSIIIVSYNGKKYVDECIKKISKQTFKDYEIIFVDDGSTDNTEEAIKKYDEVKYFKIEHKGVSYARNYGIQKSKGKYFLFVDVDDYVDYDLLKVLDENTKEEVDLVKYGYKLVYHDKTTVCFDNDTDIISGESAFKLLCNKKMAFDMICIYLYNRNYWDKNNYAFAEGYYHEDFGLIPFVLLNASYVKIINFPAYYYVQTDNSITRNEVEDKKRKKAYDCLRHYDYLMECIDGNDFQNDTVMLFKSYIANALILKMSSLNKKARKDYIIELKNRGVFDNIKSDSISGRFKKTILSISPNSYCLLLKVMK